MRTNSQFVLLASLCATFLTGQAALAQGSARNAPAAETGGLEEVVVTARKKTETLIDVPLAVAAVTAEQIENRQINSIDDLARFTPGLVFSNAFGRNNERPVIRGAASVLAGTNPTVEAGSAYFIDGVYYPGDISSIDLSDVARAEVIRGPQSALYGRNTYAGAVNFITKSPPKELEISTRGSVDSDERRASLRIAGPISERVSASLSARYYKFDGQWKNQLTGLTIGQEQSKDISLRIDAEPTDNIKLTLRGQFNEGRDGTRPLFFQSGELNNCYPGTRSLASYVSNITPSTNTNQYYCGEVGPQLIYLNDRPVTQTITPTPGFPLTSAYTAAQVASLTAIGFGSVLPTGGFYDTRTGVAFSGVNRDLSFASAMGTWDIAGSGYTLTLDGGIRSEKVKSGSDSDHSAINIIPVLAAVSGISAPPGVRSVANSSASDIQKVKDYSVEVKFGSPANRAFRWLVGGYHYEQERRVFQLDFGSLEGQSSYSDLYDTLGTALFGSVEYDFTDRFKGTVELRRAKDNKGVYNFQQRPGFGSPGPQTFGGNADISQTRTIATGGIPNAWVVAPGTGEWTSTTPRVTLAYKFSPDLNLYVNYAKGNKPGGYNGGIAITNGRPADVTFQPETSTNYELGIKGLFFERHLALNVAFYHTKLDDIQLTTPIQAATGALTSIATNQGSGTSQGVEIDARWKATEFLGFGFTYALADTKFTKGCDDFQWTLTSGGGLYQANNPAASINPNGKGTCSIVGNPFPLAAKNTASLTSDFHHPVMDGRFDFYANGSLSFVDKKAVQVHADPWSPAATVLDLRFGLETDAWSVGIYGRNLTNEDAPPGVTRWLHQYLLGANSTAAFPNGTLDLGLPTATVGGVGQYAYSLPRGFFGNLRRQRQVGVEASYKFNGGDKAPTSVKVLDSDGDGVTDDIDRCPGTAPGTPVDAAGCPLPKDSDGDGVMDPNDKCPNTPAGAKVDASGCELDADGDGVVDRLDKCPSTPAGAKVDANGCEFDSDGDGVVDSADKCPDTPKGDRVDVYGCSFKTELRLPGVVFETNKADLKSESMPILDGAVATLKKYPELIVEVAGHTDSVGADAFNLNLSKRRAETVMKYLKDNGVGNTLRSRGYGEKQPVASNKTDEGRSQNRRVVLRILAK